MSLIKLESIGAEDKLFDYLSKCKELKIPLYYPIPPNIKVWFREPNTEKAEGCITFNLSEMLPDSYYILLEVKDIDVLLERGNVDILSCSIIKFAHSGVMKSLNGFKKIEQWCSKEKGNNKQVFISKVPEIPPYLSFLAFQQKYRYLWIKESYPNLYHFSEQSCEIYSYYNKLTCINIEINDVYVDRKNSHKLLRSVQDDSAYAVPEEYQKYELLKKLAAIGHAIFVKGDISEPTTKKDGAKLLENEGLFRKKNSSSTSRKADSAYFFIAMNIASDSIVDDFECPQIKHLMKIPANLSKEEKKERVRVLFEYEPKYSFALKLITEI